MVLVFLVLAWYWRDIGVVEFSNFYRPFQLQQKLSNASRTFKLHSCQFHFELSNLEPFNCGIGLVPVWYWCGIGVVLVWYLCGIGVVLVWYWCGTGVVLVWYWCGISLVRNLEKI